MAKGMSFKSQSLSMHQEWRSGSAMSRGTFSTPHQPSVCKGILPL
jgi:hypothetical protein